MLRAEIIVPDMRFEVENEEEVIRAMAAYELAAVKARLRNGKSATGASLPSPKDGGRPLSRSNQLLESIEAIVKKFGKFWGASIEPTGTRSDARDRQSSSRRRTSALKKLVKETLTEAGIGEADIKTHLKRVRGRRVRSRNMDIAAILAYPPKDRRAKAGDRKVYDLFATTTEEKKNLALIAARVARVALVEKRSGERYRGRGEAT